MGTNLSQEQWNEYNRLQEQALEFQKNGKLAQALVAIDHALKIDPNSGPGWYDRGNILDDLGRYEEACDAFERSAQLVDSRSWPARANLERLMRRHNIKR